jgi:hypothetical protein
MTPLETPDPSKRDTFMSELGDGAECPLPFLPDSVTLFPLLDVYMMSILEPDI